MSTWAFLAAAVGLRKPAPAPESEPEPAPTASALVVAPAASRAATPARRAARRVIATHIMAHKFVQWMQSQGATGYWLVDEIDELREAFCDKYGFAVPYAVEFRSCLAATPGVTRGKYRLKSWEFLEVAKRTSMERPVLYRIPDRVVSETISGDFHQEIVSSRHGDVMDRLCAPDGREHAGTHVAPKGTRQGKRAKKTANQALEAA